MRVISLALALLTAGCSCSSESPGPDLAARDREGREGLLFPDLGGGELRADHAASGDDWDGDGLSNADEKRLGTDPWNRDTDGDGEGDLQEVGDPAHPNDTDADGRIDALEPSSFDSDSDGTPDEADKDEGLCSGTPRFFVNATRNQPLSLVKACSPYRVMTRLQMVGGATLEAAAGVHVQFGPGAVLLLGDSTSSGSLKLVGTSAEPVVLTSTAVAPKKGDWQGVVVEQTPSLILTQVRIEYAGAQDPGASEPRAALQVKKADSISLTSLTLAHIAGAGLLAAFTREPLPLFASFSDCTFTDLDAAAAVLDIQHLGEIGTGNSFATSGASAVVVVREGLVKNDAVWKAIGVPYQLEESTLTVDAALTLKAGVKLIVAPNTVVNVGYQGTGSLAAQGTSGAPVTLQTASPTPGSWQGLIFHGGTSTLTSTTVRGAGHVSATGKSASIYLDAAASLAASEVTVSESDGLGVYYLRAGAPPVAGCWGIDGLGYKLVGAFPGDGAHPGCKFVCQDDAQAQCVVGP